MITSYAATLYTASIISVMDRFPVWVEQLRPLEIVGVAAIAAVSMSVVCLAFIVAARKIPCATAVEGVPEDASAAEHVEDSQPGDDEREGVSPLILGAAFFAIYDGDYRGNSESWSVYSYSDVSGGNAKKLLILASKENAERLIERFDLDAGYHSAAAPKVSA